MKFDYVKTKREDVAEIPERWSGLIKAVMRHYTRFNVWVYKKSGGFFMRLKIMVALAEHMKSGGKGEKFKAILWVGKLPRLK